MIKLLSILLADFINIYRRIFDAKCVAVGDTILVEFRHNFAGFEGRQGYYICGIVKIITSPLF